jgi:hypothetical protein
MKVWRAGECHLNGCGKAECERRESEDRGIGILVEGEQVELLQTAMLLRTCPSSRDVWKGSDVISIFGICALNLTESEVGSPLLLNEHILSHKFEMAK